MLQKILAEKIIRTHYLSSYYWLLVTLPRFVGSAVGDCRNSGTSEFIRIVKRQSGVPSSARKACGYDNIQTSAGHKKNTNEKFVFFQDGDPTEVRTRVTAVKGRCLRPLDHRAVFCFYLVEVTGLEPVTPCL